MVKNFSSTKLIKLVLFIFGILLLGILVYRVGFREIIQIILGAKVYFLILGFLVYLLLVLTRALKWFLLVRTTAEVEIKYNEFLPFYFVNGLMGNITPLKSGEAITPFLFKKYLKIPAGQGFSIVILDRFFELMIFAIILVLALFYIMNNGVQNSLILSIFQWIFVGFILLITVLITIIISKKITLKILGIFNLFKKYSLIKKGLEFIEKELEIFYNSLVLFKNKKIYKFMIPLTLVSWVFEFLAFYLVFSSVLFTSFLNIAAAQVISMAATFVSFIPGGIGIGEIGAVYILNLFNYSVILSASGVLLARFVLTGTLLILGIIGTFLIKEKGKCA